MSARKTLALSFLDRYSGLVISIGSSMVLARLLTPAEMGVFAVTMVFVAVLSGLRDMGATSYLIQEKELTVDCIRATWMVQIITGCVLGVGVTLLAKPISAFYGDPIIEKILWIVAFNFLINPVGTVTIAWWMRGMQFQRVAITRFFGTLTGTSISILLAWNEMGAISLAWGSLATTCASILVTTILRPKELPGLPGLVEIRRVLAFGGGLSGASIFSSISNGAPEALIGRIQGVVDAGLLSRANGLAGIFDKLIMSAVNPVVLPLFSKNLRNGQPVGFLYLKGLSLITGLGWPFFAGLSVATFPVMRILYGDQWDAAVEVTQILCFASALKLLMGMSHQIMVAYGRIRMVVTLTVVGALLKIVASVVGGYYGLTQLGWMLTLHALIISVVWLLVTNRLVNVSHKSSLLVLINSAILTVFALIPLVLANYYYVFEKGAQAWPHLLLASAGAVVLYVVTAKLIRHPVYDELIKVVSGANNRLR